MLPEAKVIVKEVDTQSHFSESAYLVSKVMWEILHN